MRKPRVAVVGATGAVGPIVLDVLHERGFPAAEVVPFASARSAGTRVRFAGAELEVRELTADALEGFDLALFSAGGSTSRAFAPEAVARGCVVVDKSSAFRMDPAVPLVVPEVNADTAAAHHGIVSNPNCSTIQLDVRARAAPRGGGPGARDGLDLPGGVGHRRQGGRGAAIAIAGCARWTHDRARRVPSSDRVQRDTAVRGLRGG